MESERDERLISGGVKEEAGKIKLRRMEMISLVWKNGVSNGGERL